MKMMNSWKSFFPVVSIVFSKRSPHVGGHLCWSNFDADFTTDYDDDDDDNYDNDDDDDDDDAGDHYGDVIIPQIPGTSPCLFSDRRVSG